MDISTAKCKKCKQNFDLNPIQIREARLIIKTNNKYGTIFKCPLCERLTPWDPPDVPKFKPSTLIRCPKLLCPGYVLQNSKKVKKVSVTYWGCGECLGKWRTLEALDEEISRMIKKYPHRKKIYKKGKDGHWKPVYPESWKLHEWYEEKLETVETAEYEKDVAAKKAANPKDVFRCTRLACPGHLIPHAKDELAKRFKIKSVEKQWICTDCNKVVETRQVLETEIEGLVAKYPHRKLAYKKTKEGWQAVAMQNKKAFEYETALWDIESFDYEQLISKPKPEKKKAIKKSTTSTKSLKSAPIKKGKPHKKKT